MTNPNDVRQDLGASADADRASRASPQAPTGLDHPATIPCADDARLLSAGPAPGGGFEFAIQCSVVPLIAEHMVQMMQTESGEPLNCIDIEFNHEEYGPFVLSIQRRLGKTPLMLKAEADKLLKIAVDAIGTGRSEPLFAARDAIQNYLDDLPRPPSDSDRSGEAMETGTGSTEGESAGPKDIAQHE